MKKGTKWYQLIVIEKMPADAIYEPCTFQYTVCVRATSEAEAIKFAKIPKHHTHTVKSIGVKVSKASGARRLRKYQVYTKHFYYKVEAPSKEDAILFAGLNETEVSKVEEVEEYTNDIIAKQFWL
jgi:hypothetical protein